MSAPPYMRLYWGDYHRDTHHLTRGEHGSYMMLLSALWSSGGKLPNDDAVLARHALCTAEEWAAAKPILMPFFKVARGSISHKRVTAELAKYESTIGKRKAAGKLGSTVTNGKRKETSAANAARLPTYSEPEPEEREDKPSLSPAKPERASRKVSIEDGFPDTLAKIEAAGLVSAAGVQLDIEDQARRFRSHAKMSDRRLADWSEGWQAWVLTSCATAPAAALTPPPAEPFVWDGPPEIWQAAVAKKGEAWARGYVGRCYWTGTALSHASPTLIKGIVAEIGRDLNALGFAATIEHPAPTQAERAVA